MDVTEVNLREKVISLYFQGNEIDQIAKKLCNEGIKINHDSTCGIIRRYTSSLRHINSFNDIDSEKMCDRQKEFIKTIINDEKAKRLCTILCYPHGTGKVKNLLSQLMNSVDIALLST